MSFLLMVSACGSAVRPDGGDTSPAETSTGEGGTDVVPGDTPIPDDVPVPTDGPDMDTPVPDDVQPGDTPTPDDVPGMDVPVADVPVADVPTADVPVMMCVGGLTNGCPAAPPGPCPNLNDGMPHTYTFTGLTTGIPASCEGMTTGAGPDGIVPLTLTSPQDVVITAMPTGGDAAVISLFSAAGCGTMAGEMRCSNSSATMGGVARIQINSLPAGTYWVQVASGRGTATIVQAMLTMPRPRIAGDNCPGVTVTPDGMPATLSTAMFLTDADYGNTCSGPAMGHVDAVFSYTLTTMRDVTINVSATGGGGLSAEVSTMCGMRATAVGGCGMGNPVMRRIRAQAPGTYYITVDYAGAPGRNIVAQVTTAAPTMVPAGDRCPGVPLTVATTANLDTSMLAVDYPLMCAAMARTDGIFSFTAPAAGSDVLVNVSAPMGSGSALQLQSACGMTNSGPCLSSAQPSVWARYRGLTPGATYSVIGATTAIMGNLGARYVTVPAATPMAITGNDLCPMATVIPEAGGIFTGNTMAFADNTNNPAACGGCGGGVDAIYRITLTAMRRVVISTVGSSFDTFLFIRPGTDCANQNMGDVCNDDYIGTQSMIDRVLAPGMYWVVLSGCGAGARGAYTLDVATFAP